MRMIRYCIYVNLYRYKLHAVYSIFLKEFEGAIIFVVIDI